MFSGVAFAAEPPAVIGWADYERVRALIKAPTFPARDFVITAHGAKPGATPQP